LSDPKELDVPHPFLSDEWMDAARAIRDRHAAEAPPTPFKIRMNQIVTDVPFGEGTLRTYVDTSDGSIRMEKGELPDPDVTLTTDYETARQLFVEQDPQASMQAFLAGRVKIQGDMTKLMVMQAAPPDDVARIVAQEIKSITA
jgi:SCP-2 sterol transfer family